MDPLERILPDVHHLMFQHFDLGDFIEASTVSRSWNDSITASSLCMKKVRFTMKVFKFMGGSREAETKEKIEIMQRSTRPYQNVSIVCRFDYNLSIEFWNLLQTLQQSLTELKIKSIKFGPFHQSPSPISLPHLKVLKLTYVEPEVRNILLDACTVLKKLKLKTESPLKWKKKITLNPSTLACIRSFLGTNTQLEDLELHGPHQYHSFFNQDCYDNVRFHLKRLKIKTNIRLSLLCEEAERNFLKFASTQSNYLESFFIDGCRPRVLRHIFNEMPALSTIHIELMFMDVFIVKELKLQLNENIRNLSIPYVTDPEAIKEFLSIAPNLTSLFIAHLSHDTVEFIARNMMNLKKLKFRLDEIDSRSFYDQLTDDNPEVNQDIEMIVDYDYA